MKRIICLLLVGLVANSLFAQNQFETTIDKDGGKILKGIISRDVIQNDSSFKWYTSNLKGYTANTDAVNALKKNADSIQIIAFMGTWCEDSHFIIPKFFSLTDAAGFSSDKITLIGVDRQKKTLSHLSDALNIKNVPTLMVMKNGKEIGRVVEYGKYGMFDKELGEIISSIGKQ
jgi:hypothetical protein